MMAGPEEISGYAVGTRLRDGTWLTLGANEREGPRDGSLLVEGRFDGKELGESEREGPRDGSRLAEGDCDELGLEDGARLRLGLREGSWLTEGPELRLGAELLVLVYKTVPT